MNEQSAKEWLKKAWHNLSGAKIFYSVNHYTDVTAVELHCAVEKILKSFLAYENKKIPKTHELYPAFNRQLPPKEEIKDALAFSEELFEKVCDILKIDKKEVQAWKY